MSRTHVDRVTTHGDEQPRRGRLRFALAFVAVAVIAGVTASAAWSLVIVDYYGQPGSAWIIQPATTEGDGGYNNMNTSEAEAKQGQTSPYTCNGCLVRAFMARPNGFRDCDITDYGYVSCHLNPGQTVYARAFCRNPHTTSSRWFNCWKFVEP